MFTWQRIELFHGSHIWSTGFTGRMDDARWQFISNLNPRIWSVYDLQIEGGPCLNMV
jgi:hypothetical protein